MKLEVFAPIRVERKLFVFAFLQKYFFHFREIACKNKRDGENFRENLNDNFLENVDLS